MKKIFFTLVILIATSAMYAQPAPAQTQTEFSMTHAQVLNLEEVKAQIGYPEEAREAGMEGIVRCLIKVNADGKYIMHHMDATTGTTLDQIVEDHLSQLQFSPAVLDGSPITAWTPVVFCFRLTND